MPVVQRRHGNDAGERHRERSRGPPLLTCIVPPANLLARPATIPPVETEGERTHGRVLARLVRARDLGVDPEAQRTHPHVRQSSTNVVACPFGATMERVTAPRS